MKSFQIIFNDDLLFINVINTTENDCIDNELLTKLI